MVVEVIFFLPVRRQNTNVGILEKEFWVKVAAHEAVGLDDLFELDIDKVVVRVDVLLDQTLDLEEGWQQIPFIAGGIDGLVEALAVIERLEEGGEFVFGLRVEWRFALARCFGGRGCVRVEVCRRLSFCCGDTIAANCSSAACIYVLRAAIRCRSFCACCPARGSFRLDLWRFLCAS